MVKGIQKGKSRTRKRETVETSFLSEEEKEGMEEYPPQLMTDMTHENEKRYVERVVIPNLIDMRRNYHN